MARKEQQRRSRRASPPRLPSRTALGWWAFGALAAAVMVASVVDREGTFAPRRAVPDAALIAAAEQADPRILEVERRFLCPCHRCGGMELAECSCDTPGGALEAKGVIVELIAQGHGTEAVVAEIARRYGSLKPSGQSVVRPELRPKDPKNTASGCLDRAARRTVM